MGHKERLPGRGSSRKGPGVERSLGSTVGGGKGTDKYKQGIPFPKLRALFMKRRKYFMFFFSFLLFFSSASRLGKVIKANTIYCVPDIILRAFYLNSLHLIVRISL